MRALSTARAIYAAPRAAGSQRTDTFFCCAAQSRRYKLMSVWYGISLVSANALKYAMVASSKRIVTERLSR